MNRRCGRRVVRQASPPLHTAFCPSRARHFSDLLVRISICTLAASAGRAAVRAFLYLGKSSSPAERDAAAVGVADSQGQEQPARCGAWKTLSSF